MNGNDRFSVRLAVAFFGIIVLVVIVGQVLLTLAGQPEMPHDAWLLAAGALGGLTGFFVSAHSSPPAPPPPVP